MVMGKVLDGHEVRIFSSDASGSESFGSDLIDRAEVSLRLRGTRENANKAHNHTRRKSKDWIFD